MEFEANTAISLYKIDYNEEFCRNKQNGILSLLKSDTVKPLIPLGDGNPLFMLLIFASSVAGSIKTELEILLDKSQKRFVAKIFVPNADLTVFGEEALGYLSNLCEFSHELRLDYQKPDIFVTAYLYYQQI